MCIAGNKQPITKDRLPAVAMIGWHVAPHWAAGDEVEREARYVIKMASTFSRFRSVFLFFGTGSIRVMVRVRARDSIRARIRVGLGLRLGSSESSTADCRHCIPADRLPVAGYGYVNFLLILHRSISQRIQIGLLLFHRCQLDRRLGGVLGVSCFYVLLVALCVAINRDWKYCSTLVT